MSNIESYKTHRLRDPETNPCLKEGDLAIKCLEENYYVKNMCELAFQNYNHCKSFWSNIMRQRKEAKINPVLPGEKERERIKLERSKGRNIMSAPVDD